MPNRARFLNLLAANQIAPATHRDQANRGAAAFALAAFAAPEKRWCQAVSKSSITDFVALASRVPAPGWLAAWAIQSSAKSSRRQRGVHSGSWFVPGPL